MTSIYTCEQLKRRIENHSHFYSCFNGDVKQNFNSNKDLLRQYKNSYDSMIDLKNKKGSLLLPLSYNSFRRVFYSMLNMKKASYNSTIFMSD